MPMNEDAKLWQGIMSGDKEMFLALYQKYYHSLLFLGLRQVRDADLVKDSIQQQFLYIWEKRQTIKEAKNVKSYLITSFLRRLIADWKRSSGAGNLEVTADDYLIDELPTPEEMLIIKDENFHRSGILKVQLDALPKRQRELLMLRFYEGLTYEEIVQKTGLVHRTVYNKIHEALQKVRTQMISKHGASKVTIPGIFLLPLLVITSYF
jgi:RNA polymerase sigma factor (sigma-70 family)